MNDVELQVTFVFTNQVDGKLVPVEGKVSPNAAAANSSTQNLKRPSSNEPNWELQRQQQHQSETSDGDSGKRTASASCRILHGAERKLPVKDRPNVQLRTKLSTANKLPLKRSSTYTLKHEDDDFE